MRKQPMQAAIVLKPGMKEVKSDYLHTTSLKNVRTQFIVRRKDCDGNLKTMEVVEILSRRNPFNFLEEKKWRVEYMSECILDEEDNNMMRSNLSEREMERIFHKATLFYEAQDALILLFMVLVAFKICVSIFLLCIGEVLSYRDLSYLILVPVLIYLRKLLKQEYFINP